MENTTSTNNNLFDEYQQLRAINPELFDIYQLFLSQSLCKELDLSCIDIGCLNTALRYCMIVSCGLSNIFNNQQII
jgi:hypothetical protein